MSDPLRNSATGSLRVKVDDEAIVLAAGAVVARYLHEATSADGVVEHPIEAHLGLIDHLLLNLAKDVFVCIPVPTGRAAKVGIGLRITWPLNFDVADGAFDLMIRH